MSYRPSRKFFTLADFGDGRIEVRSSYNMDANDAFRAIGPFFKVQWIPNLKVRAVWPNLLPDVQRIGSRYYGIDAPAPMMRSTPSFGERRTIEAFYIGGEKSHGSDRWHSGMNLAGDFIYILPHALVRDWFDPFKPEPVHERIQLDDSSLYAMIGARPGATQDELKKAYRLAQRSWHPDFNPGDRTAHDMTIRINQAWETLKDPSRRAAYDAGLALMQSLDDDSEPDWMKSVKKQAQGWQLIKRNGLIDVTCDIYGDFHIVTAIHGWQDITNNQGQVLASSWDFNAARVVKSWI